jgi:hypothetical protein
MTLPSASSHGNSAGSWNITIRSGAGAVTALPSDSTVPESGFVSPAMMSSRVDFPQPLGPIRHTNSPCSISSDTLSSA